MVLNFFFFFLFLLSQGTRSSAGVNGCRQSLPSSTSDVLELQEFSFVLYLLCFIVCALRVNKCIHVDIYYFSIQFIRQCEVGILPKGLLVFLDI